MVFCVLIAVLFDSLTDSVPVPFTQPFKLNYTDFAPEPLYQSLLRWDIGHSDEVKEINSRIDKFFVGYGGKLNDSESSYFIECPDSNASGPKLLMNESCYFDLKSLGPCTPNTTRGYGYEIASPCIYIKIKKRENWIPEFLTRDELATSGFSKQFTNYLEDNDILSHPKELKRIWVDCKGISEYDQHLAGKMSYYPSHGFPEHFFPYSSGQIFYQEPIIAVYFEKPRSE